MNYFRHRERAARAWRSRNWIAASAFGLLAMTFSSMSFAEPKGYTLKRVETYLNGLSTVSADFTQYEPGGTESTGKFYLQRPGKMRWEYKPPNPILMISDGTFLVYYDSELEQVSNIPLGQTMLSFLARDPIRLDDPKLAVDDVTSKDGVVSLTVFQKEKPEEGKLTLEFSDMPLTLRNMVVVDASRQTTRVAFDHAQFGEKLDKNLFVFKDPRKPRKRS